MLPSSLSEGQLARRQVARRLFLGTVGLAAAACAAPAVAPTAAPSPGTPAAPPAGAPKPAATAAPAAPTTPKPAAPTPSKPAAPTPARKTADWEQIVAAAKREGQIVVFGPPGTDNRDALTLAFPKRHPEIQVDLTGAQGTPNAQKLVTERAAGLRQVDLWIGPTSTFYNSLLRANAVVPIQDFLVGPEIDPSKWLGRKLDFSDEAEKYNLVQNSAPVAPWMFSPARVSASEFKSWKDLLQPRWKGKIVMYDPRITGNGEGIVTFWYLTESLGKPFIQQFFAQTDVVLSRDARQALDWVVRGQHEIALGGSSTLAAEMKRRGLPIEPLDGSDLQEITYLGAATGGGISVIEGGPHPNATKVYLNWLLSQEGQTVWSRASGAPSRRPDVPTDHVDPADVPRPGVKYLESYKERYLRRRPEVQEFLKTVLPEG